MRHRTAGKFLAAALALVMTLGLLPAFAAGEKADTIYRNGNLITMDEKNPSATALAVVGTKLVYVGDEAGVDAYVGPNTKVVDLGGKTVIPGLVEGHMHIGNLGTSLLMIDAFWKPKDVILAAVKAEAEKAQPGEWIQGRGWMNTVWENTDYPSKEELDAVAPNNPVYLVRADAHMAWVNSKALELAKITKDTPNPQGGEILKTASGEVLGCLTDTAMNPVKSAIPAWSTEKQQEAILLAQGQLFSYGFTSALDAGATVEQLNNFKALYEDGSLKLRLYPLVMFNSLEGPEADYVRNTKPTELLYDDHMAIQGVKIIGDGSLGSRSSALLEDYSDRAGHKGNYRFTDEEIYKIIKTAYDNGYQTGVHAIGDGSNHQVLNAYERVMKENPREDPRLRIEHFQILTQEDITRAIKLGVLPAMQFTHATSDLLMAEDRIGSERIKGAYAWRTVIDQGSIIIGGSDAPVELVNPFHGLYAGVTRKTRAGDPDGGWYPNEKVTREEALKSFTLWAAYGQFEEGIKGSLEAGKLADFVVLDRDYLTCPEDDIKDIQVLTTVSGGEEVYTRAVIQPTIMWNAVPVTFIDAPRLEGGTVSAPLAALTSAMGAEVKREGGKATVTYNEKSVTLDVKTEDGVDYLAVRPLFEGLGYTVTWYPLSMTVSTHK